MKFHYVLRAAALVLCSFSAAAAQTAAQAAPQPGRYMPLYPGLYTQLRYVQDERDQSFDPDGVVIESAVPSLAGETAFPQQRGELEFSWHFPMFESQGLPFFSSRTHLARVTLGYERNTTDGALADFNASERGQDRDTDQADDLRDDGSGIADVLVEFGSYLIGSPASEWRTRKSTPFALLGLLGLNLPYGEYDRDSATSAGTNTAALQGKLALHWQPWTGAFMDAAYGYRAYAKNQDAAYGFLEPTYQGDDRFWDVSVGHRLFWGFYASAFARGRTGEPNGYLNPSFAPNSPPAPSTTPASDNYPTPGLYHDDGTALRSYGYGLQWFLTQRLLLAAHYTVPDSGRSGRFLLPFTNRQPAGCTPTSPTCSTSEGDSVLVDGQGAARSYASDSFTISLSYQFGQGDTFTCTGCAE